MFFVTQSLTNQNRQWQCFQSDIDYSGTQMPVPGKTEDIILQYFLLTHRTHRWRRFFKGRGGGRWKNTGYRRMACILLISITFPWGNFLRKFSCLLVTPNSNAGSTLTSDPLYLAAMSTLYARKLFEYVYRVWKTTGWLRWVRCQRDGRDKSGYGKCTYAWRHFSACNCTFFGASIYVFMYVTWAYVDGDRSVIKETYFGRQFTTVVRLRSVDVEVEGCSADRRRGWGRGRRDRWQCETRVRERKRSSGRRLSTRVITVAGRDSRSVAEADDRDRARRRLSCFRALSKSIFLLLDVISPYNYIIYSIHIVVLYYI